MSKKLNIGNLSKGSEKLSGFNSLIQRERKIESEDQEFNEVHKFKSILWTDIPKDIHKALKMMATDENTSMSKLIYNAVINYYNLNNK